MVRIAARDVRFVRCETWSEGDETRSGEDETHIASCEDSGSGCAFCLGKVADFDVGVFGWLV